LLRSWTLGKEGFSVAPIGQIAENLDHRANVFLLFRHWEEIGAANELNAANNSQVIQFDNELRSPNYMSRYVKVMVLVPPAGTDPT